MTAKGYVNLITDPTTFFAPILFGQGPPSSGYAPTDSPVIVTLYSPGFIFGLFSFSMQTTVNTSDGSFEFQLPGDYVFDQVAITVSYLGYPYYRSGFFPFANLAKELNIFIYEPRLPTSDGISAGQVSTALSTTSLPGNTSISVNSNGFNISGSESEVSLDFGLRITPDTSANLNVYFDLALNGWNINVGWPESWCESATDVLNSIKAGLQTAGSAANKLVASQISTILQSAPLNLSSGEAITLLDNVSIQFVYASYPNNHTWGLSNKTDSTIVIFPQPVIGYPRGW